MLLQCGEINIVWYEDLSMTWIMPLDEDLDALMMSEHVNPFLPIGLRQSQPTIFLLTAFSRLVVLKCSDLWASSISCDLLPYESAAGLPLCALP